MAGDTVFLSGEGVTVQYSDPIRKLVSPCICLMPRSRFASMHILPTDFHTFPYMPLWEIVEDQHKLKIEHTFSNLSF